MISRLRWVWMLPTAVLVGAAMILSSGTVTSCGSGKSNTFATPLPPGPFIDSIAVFSGPSPVATATPTSATAVATPMPTPTGAPTTVAACNTYNFHATAEMSFGQPADVTDPPTQWTADQGQTFFTSNGSGLYSATCANPGVMSCGVNIFAANGGIISAPYHVTVTGLSSCK